MPDDPGRAAPVELAWPWPRRRRVVLRRSWPSFANPAVTTARMFSDTFAGIAPASVAMFIVMQLIGGALAYGLVRLLYPQAQAVAAELAAEPQDRLITRSQP